MSLCRHGKSLGTCQSCEVFQLETDIATLELENRMMRERNERLERENKELAENLASLTEIKNDSERKH